MTAVVIDGKKKALEIRENLAREIAEAKARPVLAVVQVGDNPASQVYVRNKKRACEEVGFLSEEYRLAADVTQDELLSLIESLNARSDISGILVQLPLPRHLDEKAVLNVISPLKDVDAFQPVNVGRIMIGDYHFLPCTPAGVMELLKSADVDLCGKRAAHGLPSGILDNKKTLHPSHKGRKADLPRYHPNFCTEQTLLWP